jgi:hypothetical protein
MIGGKLHAAGIIARSMGASRLAKLAGEKKTYPTVDEDANTVSSFSK